MRYTIISLTAILFLILGISGNLFAQNRDMDRDGEPCEQIVTEKDKKGEQEERKKNHQEMREIVQAKKIAFFTDYLDLTPSEAEKFWPLYNSFWKRRMDAHRNAKTALKNLNKVLNSAEGASETTIKALMDRYISLSKKEFEIMEEMFGEMNGILPVKKTAKLISAEEKFREQLIRQLKEKKD